MRTIFSVALGIGLSRKSADRPTQTRLAEAVTTFYNKMHGTEIQPRDIWMYRSGFAKDLSKDTQLIYVQDYLMRTEIGTRIEELKLTPFDDEERKVLEPYKAILEELMANDQALAAFFFTALESQRGDLFAKIKSVNIQLIQTTGNAELKDEISNMIQGSLSNILINLGSRIVLDHRMVVRVTLITALEAFKEKMEFSDPIKAERWQALLNSFQQECRRPASSLIADLQAALPPGFFQLPLALLLWDDVVANDVFDA